MIHNIKPDTKVIDRGGRVWDVFEAKRHDQEGSWGALFVSDDQRRYLPSYRTWNSEKPLGNSLGDRSASELLRMLHMASPLADDA